MKRILITGANSYIGTSVEKWLLKESDKYEVDTIDMKDDRWIEKDFSEYDVVFHVAGIAHIKETKKNKDLYYRVNRDLAYDTAKKAKLDGAKQFIFLSSMSIYGMEIGTINKDTVPSPKSNYGKSKLEAENLITLLQNDTFKVAVIRPPMVYGRGCKGNYVKLEKLALKSPIFPDIKNKRSMIYIDNLCEFVKIIIDDNSKGLYFPQNNEYICTSEMVRMIAEEHGNRIFLINFLNPLLKLLNFRTMNKVFGDLTYDMSISRYDKEYIICSFRKSIYLIEGGS